VKALVMLAALGVGLIVVVTVFGGTPAAIGGSVALVAQVWAVVLLRPKMKAPTPAFMAHWLGGMGIRVVALGALVVWAVTHRATLPPVATMLGFVGVLLPLLILETRFLR
jgi:hypothetical protein